MKRRTFIKATGLATLASSFPNCKTTSIPSTKTHILTISYDDGFKKSFYKLADIYEEFGLHACLNVIASGHFPDFKAVDDWILPELMGNFDDWNALKARGHEVMPHSWQHLNLAKQPIEKAKELIVRCLDYFEQNLEGYDPQNAVFNFPFNASTPELETFTLTKVRAIRTGGKSPINPIPSSNSQLRLSCFSMGSENIDKWVERSVKDFLKGKGGWLILNAHGLDDEGWGPISSNYLKDLLKRLVKIKKLEILPVGEVIKKYGK